MQLAVSHALTRTNLDVEWTLPVDVDVRHGIFGGIASLPHASVGATRNPRRLFVDSIGQVACNHSHSPLGGHVALHPVFNPVGLSNTLASTQNTD